MLRTQEIPEDTPDMDNLRLRAETSGEIRITDIRLLDESGAETDGFEPGYQVSIEIGFQLNEPVNSLWHLNILSIDNIVVWASDIFPCDLSSTESGTYHITCRIDKLPLRPGYYWISLKVRGVDDHIIQGIPNISNFRIETNDVKLMMGTRGLIYIDHHWSGIGISTDRDGRLAVTCSK